MSRPPVWRITVDIEAHQEDGEWIATCPDLGLASQGASLDEALEMLQEAAVLFFEISDELGILDEELVKKGLLTRDLATHSGLRSPRRFDVTASALPRRAADGGPPTLLELPLNCQIAVA